MDSKQDGYFDCSLHYCEMNNRCRCCNPCYVDCPYYKLRHSLYELIKNYEDVKEQL